MTDHATPDAPQHLDESALIVVREYDEGEGGARFVFRADAHAHAQIDVWGRGTMESTRALVAALDVYRLKLQAGEVPAAHLLIDLREAKGGPVRAQFVFGKWVLKHRKTLKRAAICGASAFERRITTGVTTIGRVKRFKFFKHLSQGAAWLAEQEQVDAERERKRKAAAAATGAD